MDVIITTPWKEYREGETRYRIRAKYGIDYNFAKRNNQAPHFSITGEIERADGRRWVEDSGGVIHEQIERHFPELARFTKWHLVSTDGPLHYIANSKYFWEQYNGTSKFERRPYDPDPLRAFLKTAVVIENELPPQSTPWPRVKQWLEERLEFLMDAWQEDMEELEVLE